MTNQQQPPARTWDDTMPFLAELSDTFLFGQIWERPELSKRDRSMITVAVLTALYRTDQLRSHMIRALNNGVTEEELKEIVTHVTMYAGWPVGANAASLVKQVLDTRKE